METGSEATHYSWEWRLGARLPTTAGSGDWERGYPLQLGVETGSEATHYSWEWRLGARLPTTAGSGDWERGYPLQLGVETGGEATHYSWEWRLGARLPTTAEQKFAIVTHMVVASYPNYLHGCEIKSGRGEPGHEATWVVYTTSHPSKFGHCVLLLPFVV